MDQKMALCRHCGHKLHELKTDGPLWADADGWTVCIKAPMPVYHEPMPEGFRGAPGTIR